MVFTKNSVGIEIAGKHLRLAIVRSNFGHLRLVAVHRIADFLDLDEGERGKAIRALIKNGRIPTARVYLAIPREQGIVRQVDLPSEMGQKLADVVKLQVETLSPWPLDEIYWDFAREPHRKNQKLATITIAIIPRTVLDPWMAFFKSLGVPLSGATLSSLAFGHGANALWKDALATVILHSEASYTEGVLVCGSRLAAMNVPSVEDASAAKALIERLLSVAKMTAAEDARLIVCGAGLDSSALVDNPCLPVEDAQP